MTVIAYSDGVMAADSGAWSGGMQSTVPFPKITRAPDGSLAALAGKLNDSWKLRQWVLAGMPADQRPIWEGIGDEVPYILLAKPDGSLWFAKGAGDFAPEPQPAAVGDGAASCFVEGAMAAGAIAERAVALACDRCIYAAHPVQAECIGARGGT